MSYKDDLHKLFNQGQEKLTYYFIALAVTAIGFSVYRSENMSLSIWQVPLGVSVVSWALSIYCGVSFLKYRLSIQYANYEYLRFYDGTHPEIRENPLQTESVKEGILSAMELNNEIGGRLYRWQYRFFYVGIIGFLIWHIIQMSFN